MFQILIDNWSSKWLAENIQQKTNYIYKTDFDDEMFISSLTMCVCLGQNHFYNSQLTKIEK